MKVSTFSSSVERYSGSNSAGSSLARVQAKEVNSPELLTPKERNFFKTLFPENIEQIEKHVVFNRNGKVNSMTFAKGSYVDGLA
jgi:hypothetical protein